MWNEDDLLREREKSLFSDQRKLSKNTFFCGEIKIFFCVKKIKPKQNVIWFWMSNRIESSKHFIANRFNDILFSLSFQVFYLYKMKWDLILVYPLERVSSDELCIQFFWLPLIDSVNLRFRKCCDFCSDDERIWTCLPQVSKNKIKKKTKTKQCFSSESMNR